MLFVVCYVVSGEWSVVSIDSIASIVSIVSIAPIVSIDSIVSIYSINSKINVLLCHIELFGSFFCNFSVFSICKSADIYSWRKDCGK